MLFTRMFMTAVVILVACAIFGVDGQQMCMLALSGAAIAGFLNVPW